MKKLQQAGCKRRLTAARNPRQFMQKRIIQMIFSVLVCSIALGASAAEQTPPDQRTWDEAFVSMSTTNVHHYGDRDAARLRQLDHNRTLKLLLGWLSEDQPDYLRSRGIQCLGYNAFREAIPQIGTIIRNTTETPELRCLALNIGLRYMRVPKALEIAKDFVAHENPGMRIGAYWVLSDYGNEEAWSVLRKALTTDSELKHELVYALHKSGDPDAGQIVYNAIPAGALQGNPELAWRYALVMKDHNITSAAPVVAVLIDSSDKMTRRYAADFFVHNPTVLATQAIASNQVILSVVQERVNVLQQQIAQADRRLDRFAEQEKRLQRTPKNERGKIVLEDEQLECRAMESHRKELIARDRAKRNELTSELNKLTGALHAARQRQKE